MTIQNQPAPHRTAGRYRFGDVEVEEEFSLVNCNGCSQRDDMTNERKVLARSSYGRELVVYLPVGERRVEDPVSETCSVWIDLDAEEQILAKPDSMDDWEFDFELADDALGAQFLAYERVTDRALASLKRSRYLDGFYVCPACGNRVSYGKLRDHALACEQLRRDVDHQATP